MLPDQMNGHPGIPGRAASWLGACCRPPYGHGRRDRWGNHRCHGTGSLTKPINLAGSFSRLVAGSEARQVRKNTSRIAPRTRTASPVEATSSASIEGPGSACRDSVAVSTIRPFRRVAITSLDKCPSCLLRQPPSCDNAGLAAMFRVSRMAAVGTSGAGRPGSIAHG